MKKFNKSTAIVLSIIMFVVVAVGFVLSFVPIQFSKQKYVSLWNTINVSTDMAGGVYGEYTITTETPTKEGLPFFIHICKAAEVSSCIAFTSYKSETG